MLNYSKDKLFNASESSASFLSVYILLGSLFAKLPTDLKPYSFLRLEVETSNKLYMRSRQLTLFVPLKTINLRYVEYLGRNAFNFTGVKWCRLIIMVSRRVFFPTGYLTIWQRFSFILVLICFSSISFHCGFLLKWYDI
jgi:hypothetical protein